MWCIWVVGVACRWMWHAGEAIGCGLILVAIGRACVVHHFACYVCVHDCFFCAHRINSSTEQSQQTA